MALATKPLMLDETGQAIAEAIRGISLGNYVIVNVNNYNLGSVQGAGLYPAGTLVTLIATPKSGCYFVAWLDANGNVLSADATYSFTPTENTVINAYFSLQGTVKIVSWANGSDSELKDMLDAHYAGIINIYDFWKIGDRRTVTIGSMGKTYDGEQIVNETHEARAFDFILVDDICKGMTPVDSSIEKFAFIVEMNNTYPASESGYIHRDESPVTWDECDRKRWCETIFKEALGTFSLPFRPFRFKYGVYEEGQSVLKDSESTLFHIPPIKCLFGDTHNGSILDHEVEYEYYDQWRLHSIDITTQNKPAALAYYWSGTMAKNSSNNKFIVTDNRAYPGGAKEASASQVLNTYALHFYGCI